MAQKKLEKGSQYEKYDLDGDGIVTDEEFEMDEKLVRLENEDKRQDAQRYMAWFALAGMLLYPSGVVFALLIGLDQAAKILGDMAAVYYVSVAAIVAAYFGTQALSKKQDRTSKMADETPKAIAEQSAQLTKALASAEEKSTKGFIFYFR